MKLAFCVLALFLASCALAEQSDDALISAAAALERGDGASAESTLRSFLAKAPNDAKALGLLGAALDTERKFTEADEVYRRALQLSPPSATLLNNFANHQLTAGNLEAARVTYLKVIAIDPSRENANLQLASIYLQRKQGAEAMRYLEKLPVKVRQQPQVEILRIEALFLNRRDTEANALLTALLSTNDPRATFSSGLALASIGKYPQAEDLFSKTLTQVPGNFDALFNLGLAAYHAGHLDRAREVLESALTQNNGDPELLYNLAQVDIDLHDGQAALQLLAEAARIDPNSAKVQLSIAQTTSALGYYADALPAYDRYLQLVPNNQEILRERAFILGASGKRQEGVTALQDFLRTHPNDVTALYELGSLQIQSDPAQAEKQLNKALAINQHFAPARFGRGILLLARGEAGAALPDLQDARQRYPDNPTVLDRLGEAYLALNNASEAIAALHEASLQAPGDARIWMHLSRAYTKAGRVKDAQAALGHFRSLDAEGINKLPLAGLVDALALPQDQLQARYRTELQKRLQAKPDDPVLNLRQLKLALDAGDTKQAESVASHLLSLSPPALIAAEAGRDLLGAGQYGLAKTILSYSAKSLPDAQLDLALAAFHAEGPQAGLAALDAVDPSGRSGDYYLARFQMAEAANQANAADAALSSALASAPQRPELYHDAALYLAEHSKPDQALQLVSKGLAVVRDNPDLLLTQAAMLGAAHKVGEAEKALQDLEKRWPEWASPYVTYGIVLEGQKRSGDARKQLQTAVTLGAASPEAYFYYAKSTLDVAPEEIDSADQAVKQALMLAPEDPDIQLLAGRIDVQKHRYQQAVSHLNEAVRLRPDYLQARFTLAQAYRALGRKEDAARESQEFQRLRALHPESEDDTK